MLQGIKVLTYYFLCENILTSKLLTLIYSVPYIQVRVGSNYKYSGGQLLNVEKITIHPKYNYK